MTDLGLGAWHDNTTHGCDIYRVSGIYVARGVTANCQGSDGKQNSTMTLFNLS